MKLRLLIVMLFVGMIFGNAQVNSVAVVGEAAGGWPGDPGNPGPTDIHQMTSADGENWTMTGLILTNAAVGGGLKFRANNDWTINWGSVDFPNGIATQGGANILCVAGVYDVTFNSTTGVYGFTPNGMSVSVVKLVGTAVADPSGIQMVTTDAETYTASNVTLVDGFAQFDIDAMLYGGDTFPTGTIVDATLNIPIVGGNYTLITVNITTGAYNFIAAPVYPLISVNGSAVGGSGDGYDLDMSTIDGINYHRSLGTINGELKFRRDHAWTENYGSTAFPTGTASLNGDAIPVPLGSWTISFNLITKEYTFDGSTGNPTISIVGNAAGGWPGDPGNPGPIDIHQMTTEDGINYTIYALPLTDGDVKFRQDNNWTLNWGSVDWPSGIGAQNSANIPAVAGTYTITFNRITGEYNFGAPNRIAIVGTGVGGWPTGAIGEVDTHQLESTDGVNFRLNGIEITDGEVKFRQNNSWDVFWGGTSLTGTLVLNGPSIPTIAGIYSVELNKITGNYSLSTNAPSMHYFKIYPNPSQNVWNFTSAKQAIETIQVVDVLGKTVMTVAPKEMTATVDASSLTRGLYFAKIATATATETVKLVKN